MNSPDDDHVFCELSEESLLQLRPRIEYPTLNEMQVEQLKRQILQAVGKTIDKDGHKDDPDFRRRRDVFLQQLAGMKDLESLTLAQAQNRLLRQIAELQQPQQVEQKQDRPAPLDDSSLSRLKSEINQISPAAVKSLGIEPIKSKLLNDIPVTYGDLSQLQKALSSENLEKVSGTDKKNLNQVTDIQRAANTFRKAATRLRQRINPGYSSGYSLGYKFLDDLDDAEHEYASLSLDKEHKDAWKRNLDQTCKKKIDRLTCSAETYDAKASNLESLLNLADKQDASAISSVNETVTNIDSSFPTTGSILNLDAIADAAHNAISAFAKPDDVACATTILPSRTMRYDFGQKVAEEYLGVQITVRNLNAEKEFLLHGADLAVDMDLSAPKPLHSRFFSGVDKQNVRAYMLAARDYDTRSLVVHTAESLSTLIGSVAPIWGGAVTDASSVFAGGFLPALTHVYTDSHTEQLNQLNDVGFSASRNDRTFVPKSGSTQFVIFVPVRPLEQAWWTQKCVEAIPLGRSGPLTSPTGLDIEVWRRICYDQLSKNPAVNLPKSQTAPSPALGTINAGPITDSLPYFIPARVKYSKWTPTTYALLKELSFSIIAGTHVTLNSDTHPDISQLDCPHTGVGDVDFAAAKSGVLTCNLSGVNLDKVDHVTLRAATDTQTLDAAVKPANGGKVATIDLNVSALCPLQKTAYKIYTVTSNGIEDGGTQTIHLSQEPFLTDAPTPASISSAPTTLSLKGCHLDQLQAIQLGDASYKTPLIPASGQDSGSASVGPIASGDDNLFKKWPADEKVDKSFTLSVLLVSKTDQSNPYDSKQTVTLTKVATNPDAAAKSKPAAKRKPAAN